MTLTALLQGVLIAFVGLANGLAVGSGLVAFLVVLDVIPRMAQISGSLTRGPLLEGAVVAGALFWTCVDLFDIHLRLPYLLLAVPGMFFGAFIGAVAAALTEVLNVFPIIARRLRMESYIPRLLAAMVLGKILGSLFEWLAFRTH
jgi:stage V sporulation protein AB